MIYEILVSAIASTTIVSTAVPPPPPSRTTSQSTRNDPAVVSFTPNGVRCNGKVVRPVFAQKPKPAILPSYVLNNSSLANQDSSFDVGFAIAKTGRTMGIQDPTNPTLPRALRNTDIAPSLATWKFAPSNADRDCILNVKVAAKPLATAALSDAYRSWALRSTSSTRFRKLLFKRITPAGSNCYKIKRTTLLAQHRPDYRRIKGERTFAALSYDIGKDGRTQNIEILESDSNMDFDEAAVAAISKNLYSTESNPARTGCIGYFTKGVDQRIYAPALPEKATVQNAPTCTLTDEKWRSVGKKVFPPNFGYRGVEGWAYLRFDVAPWGQISNVNVIKAEPAAQFGQAAKRLIRTARLPKSDRGHTGCVKRVRYRLKRKKLPFGNQGGSEAQQP